MTELTVMTFNVKRNFLSFGRYAWANRCNLVAQVIRNLGPDIVGTQELTLGALGDLARLLPEYSYVGEARRGEGKGEFTAVFYRSQLFDLAESGTFWLSKTPARPSRDPTTFFPRTCTWCELIPKGEPERPLRVYNTHLDHLSYFARVRGLGIIWQEISRRHRAAPGPVILMGDFNASPHSRTLKKWAGKALEDKGFYLADAYNVVASRQENEFFGRSYHGFHDRVGGQPIDYIFTSKDVTLHRVNIHRAKVDDLYPSDHFPVVARVAF